MGKLCSFFLFSLQVLSLYADDGGVLFLVYRVYYVCVSWRGRIKLRVVPSPPFPLSVCHLVVVRQSWRLAAANVGQKVFCLSPLRRASSPLPLPVVSAWVKGVGGRSPTIICLPLLMEEADKTLTSMPGSMVVGGLIFAAAL